MSNPTDCPHNAKGYCLISTKLANLPVPISEDACAACVRHSIPRAINSVTCSKAIQYRKLAGLFPTQDLLDCVRAPTTGVGTELERLIETTRSILASFRLDWILPAPSTCGCSAARALMNLQGAKVCRVDRHQYAAEIANRWQEHLPAVRFVPFIVRLIELYILRAVRNVQAKETTNG